MNEKKVLYIAFKQPSGILVGGGMGNQRSLNTLRDYFGANNVVTEYIHTENERNGLFMKIKAAWMFLFDYHNGLTPRRIRQLTEQAQHFDYVFIDSSVLGIIAKALRQKDYKGKIIVHFHNIESIYYDSKMPKYLPGRGIVIRCAEHNDRYACQYADKIIALSQRDSSTLEKKYGRKADAIIGTGLKDVFVSADKTMMTSSRPRCLFVGAYFKPNNDGILWFVKNVLPYVNIELIIAGKNMARLKAEQPCLKNIEVVTDVPDLRPYFESADFMILPIFSGSGMKIKTCESLMYGKNIIGSDEAFEGYELDADKVGGRCNTPESFIECINHYITHPVPRFNAYSREVYLTKHSEDSTRQTFCSVFE